MQSPDIKNRTARNSIFIIREGLKELRYHASRMGDDVASIDRVIKESDLLSQTCKKLLNFVDVPETKTCPKIGPKIDVPHLLGVLHAVKAGALCADCGGLRHDA